MQKLKNKYLAQFKDQDGYFDGEAQEAFEGFLKAATWLERSHKWSWFILSAVLVATLLTFYK